MKRVFLERNTRTSPEKMYIPVSGYSTIMVHETIGHTLTEIYIFFSMQENYGTWISKKKSIGLRYDSTSDVIAKLKNPSLDAPMKL